MRLIEVDEDVGKIARHMEDTMIAPKLYHVAKALAQLADLVWAHHVDPREKFRAFNLRDD